MNHPTGTVYLIGAGPGDPELLTVKGLRLLQQADVILYDALLSEELLDQASPSAKLIYVGKRAGGHAMQQGAINHLLLAMASVHQTVVRLKGGDPFVFGRGSEEMLFLRAAGVAVQVVPGVTSAIGALAYAGVPVTHRNMAGNFAVVTGHRASDSLDASPGDDQPWEALAALDTLVVLMGLRKLPQISKRLLAAGRDPETPAVAIQWGTLSKQAVVVGTLANLSEQVKIANLQTPATIVVGEVAAFAEQLNWFPAWRSIGEETNAPMLLPA